MRSGAANLGLDKAKGKYICLLDDDDYFLKNHISQHVAAQEKNDNLWSVSKTVESIENSDGLELEKAPGKLYDFNELKFLFFENYFPSNSVVFQKKLVKKVGGFDKSLQVFEDWDMWIRMYLETKPVFVDEITSVYTTRNGENNVRTSVKSRDVWSDCFMKIMEKYKNGNYKFSGDNTYLIDVIKFLPDHSERWYKMKEENQELKDSLAFRIYKSGFYKLLKRFSR
jgi:glycosyltransferase involved in cell wall biosynthesis